MKMNKTADSRLPHVQALAAKYFATDAVTCKKIGEGGSAWLYSAQAGGTAVCIKVYRTPGANEEEAVCLRALSGRASIPFPAVYAVENAQEGQPLDAMIMEHMNGVCSMQPRFRWKSGEKRSRLSDRVTDALIQIHSTTNTRFGSLQNPEYGSWEEYYFPLAQKLLEQTEPMVREGGFRAQTFETMQRAFGRAADIFSEPVREAVLIHGDFWAANILVDPETLEPTALIDPFDSMWADREYELFALNNAMKKSYHLYETYRQKVPLSKMCDVKCAFYAMFKEVLWMHHWQSGYTQFMTGLAKNLDAQMKKFGLLG